LFASPVRERIHAGGAGDIERGELCFGCAEFLAFGGDGFEAIEAAGAEEEFRAFTGEGAGGGGAESAGGTGNQNPFVGE
jgi:hypothetical protein